MVLKEKYREIHDRILKHRERALLFAGLAGIVLAFIIYGLTWLIGLGNENGNKILQSSLTILALGLPIFFTLWLFRTHDVQRQIDKTQESINNSSFFECARMLTTGVPSSGSQVKHQHILALEQLAYLKSETEFDKQRIDYLTQNIDLNSRILTGARLNNLDLSDANLNGVILEKAILKGTKFGDNILSVQNLKKAVYNQATIFPENFNPEEKEMKRDDI